MALTGNGLRVPRGPLGFLAGLIDGFQPSVPAIQAQQQRRREEAAKKRAGKSSTVTSTSTTQGSETARTPKDGPTAADYATEYSFGGGPPSWPTGIEGLIVPSNSTQALPDRRAAPEEGFFSNYFQGTMGNLRRMLDGHPPGRRANVPNGRQTPPSIRLGASFPAGGTAMHPAGGSAGAWLPGAPEPVLGGSERQRYASHLQAAGLPEALVRHLTAERYGV